MLCGSFPRCYGSPLRHWFSLLRVTFTPNSSLLRVTLTSSKEQVVKEQVVGATILLITHLKQKTYGKQRRNGGNETTTKTQPKTLDSLRRDVPQVDVLIQDADTLLRKPESL